MAQLKGAIQPPRRPFLITSCTSCKRVDPGCHQVHRAQAWGRFRRQNRRYLKNRP